MAKGKWLERNEAAESAIKKESVEYRAEAKADREVVKKATADYKVKWAEEKKVRAADRERVMRGE